MFVGARGLGKSTTHTTTKNTIPKNPSKIRRAKFRKNTKNQKYDEIRSKIRFLILSPCYLFALLKKKSKIRQKYDGQKYDDQKYDIATLCLETEKKIKLQF